MENKELEKRITAVMLFDGWVYMDTVWRHPEKGDITIQGIKAIIHNAQSFDTRSYFTSYDFLMPVWVKFRELEDEIYHEGTNYMDYSELSSNIRTAMLYRPINESFIALSDAVIWYQTIQSQQNKEK